MPRHHIKESTMPRGMHTTKTGENVYVTPLSDGHYQLR